jgi:hypothetical protein
MIVPFYQFQELAKSGVLKDLKLKVDMTPPESGETGNPLFLKDFTQELMLKLSDNQPSTVTIAYDPILKDLLETRFKDYYHPAYSDKISMIRMLLQQFAMANGLSEGRKLTFRKRSVKSLVSVPDRDNRGSLLRFNMEIGIKELDVLRNRFSDEYVLPYTISEKGLLLVYDMQGYLENPALTKLQFQVRKIFHDIRYKRVFSTEVKAAFSAYFKSMEGNAPKLVILCGETPSNLFIFRQIKVFDPFAKIMWLRPEDLSKDSDEVFDRILPKLGSDYAYESLLCDPEDRTKDPLPQSDALDMRERIGKLSREFSLREYINLEFELLERMKKHTVAIQLSHLASVLEGMKVTKDAIFTKLLEGYLG